MGLSVAEAVAQLNSITTKEQLRDLFSQLDVTAEGVSVDAKTVLYSGKVDALYDGAGNIVGGYSATIYASLIKHENLTVEEASTPQYNKTEKAICKFVDATYSTLIKPDDAIFRLLSPSKL